MATIQRRMNPAAVRGAAVRETPAPAPAPTRAPVRRPPPKVTEHTGRALTRSEMKTRGDPEPYYTEDNEDEVLRQRFSEESPPAHVKASAGLTINMQNYEFLRIDVSVTLPTAPDRLDEAFEAAAEFCVNKINDEQARWLGSAPVRKQGKGS